MSLKNDAFPASAAFDAINSSLQSDDAERKDAVKKGNAIFTFALKNKEGNIENWHIDLKDKGLVAKGEAPEGKKADGYHFWQRDYEDKEEFSERVADEKPIVTLSLSDQDFGLLVSGKKNAQTLFMSGKLKIKGDVMKATRMEPVLKKAQINAKL